MTAYANASSQQAVANIIPEFTFTTENQDDIFTLVEFEGEEKVSDLFEFELLVKVNKSDDDSDGFVDLLNDSATFSMSYDSDAKSYKGIVINVQQDVRRSIKNTKYSFYRLTFVPAIWEQKQSLKSRIFSDSGSGSVTVLDILDSEISDISTQNLGVAIHNACSFTGYEDLPFTCQYRESDFDFMSRLMERYGIYYYFDLSSEASYDMILANDSDYPELSEIYAALKDNQIDISETSPTGTAWYTKIAQIHCEQQRMPAYVKIKQEDPEHPSRPFEGIYPSSADDTAGDGRHLNNENPVSQDEAELLAQLRYERHQTQQKTWTGKSGICLLTPGYQFTLDESHQAILITSVTHKGENLDDAAVQGDRQYYKNRFEAIPASLIYRPESKTAVPVINNLETGEVFSSLVDNTVSDIDDSGRYKIRFHFVSEEDNDDLSKIGHHVRMAQPAAGVQDQVFFPLKPGVEVTIAFLGGNPDRPVITGALSNGANPSKVTSSNPEDTYIETSGVLATIAHGGRFDSSETTTFSNSGYTGYGTLNTVTDFTRDTNGFIQPYSTDALTTNEESDGKRVIKKRYGNEISLAFGDTLTSQYGNTYDFGAYKSTELYGHYKLGRQYKEVFMDQDGPLNTKVTMPTSYVADIAHPDMLNKAGPDWKSIDWPTVSKKDINLKESDVNPTIGSEWGENGSATAVGTDNGTTFNINPNGAYDPSGVKVTKNYTNTYDYTLGEAIKVEDRINKLTIDHKSSNTTQVEMDFHNGALRRWKKVKNRESWEKNYSSAGKLTSTSEGVADGDNWKTKSTSYSLGGEEKIAENVVISTPDGKHTEDKTWDARTADLMSHNIAFSSGGSKSEMNFVFAATAKSDFSFGVSTTFSLSASASVSLSTSLSAKLEMELGAAGEIKLATNASLMFEGKFSPAGIVKLFNSGLEYHGPGSKLDKEAEIKAHLQTMIIEDATCFLSMKKLKLEKGVLSLEDKPVFIKQGLQFSV